MAQFRIRWSKFQDAWIDPQFRDQSFEENGWSIQAPYDEDFANTPLDSRWTVRNRPTRGFSSNRYEWGKQNFHALELGVDDFVTFSATARNACHISQAAPQGDYRIEVSVWQGIEGILSTSAGRALIPLPPAPLNGALVVDFGSGDYLLFGYRRSRDLEAPSSLFLISITGNSQQLIAERPMEGEMIRLRINKVGHAYDCSASADGAPFRSVGSFTAQSPAATLGITAFSGAELNDRSRVNFVGFRVEGLQLPASYPEILFDAIDALEVVDWDFSSFNALAYGSGQVIFQYRSDATGSAFNGSWLKASQIQQIANIQSRVLQFKAKLAGGGNATIHLKEISLSGDLSTGIQAPIIPDQLAAIAKPGQVYLGWNIPNPNPHITAIEIHRRRQGEGYFTLFAKRGASSRTFLDKTIKPGGYYEYVVRSVNILGTASPFSQPLGIPSPIGGRLTRSQSWTANLNPYIVYSTLYVEGGSSANPTTLSIGKGVIVQFLQDAGLVIGGDISGSGNGLPGRLKAQGSSQSPIHFTSVSDNALTKHLHYALPIPENLRAQQLPAVPGSWPGLIFSKESTDDSYIKEAIIRFAGHDQDGGDLHAAISLIDSSPDIAGCRVEDNANHGLHIRFEAGFAGQVSVTRSLFAENSGAGISLEADSQSSSSLEITESVIAYNREDGVQIDAGRGEVRRCIIRNNGGWGINSDSEQFSVDEADLTENSAGGLTYYGVAGSFSAQDCWWGDASGPRNSGNPQGSGQGVMGTVNYQPFRSTSVFGSGATAVNVTLFDRGTRTAAGTTQAGNLIRVLVNDVGFGTAVADFAGNFLVILDEAIPESLNHWEILAEDPEGNESPAQDFDTDDTEEAQPSVQILSPADDARFNHNSDVDVTAQGTQIRVSLEVSGGASLDRTELVVNPGTPQESRNAMAGSATAVVTLQDGNNTLEAVTEDPNGRQGGSHRIHIVLDPNIPDAPVISAPSDGHRTNQVAVVVTGTAGPNLSLTLREQGGPIAQGRSDAQGNYSIPWQATDGPHRFTVIAQNPQGIYSATSNSVLFTLDRMPPRVEITRPMDRTDTALGIIPVYGRWESENPVQIDVNGQQATLYDISTFSRVVNGIEVQVQSGYFRVMDITLLPIIPNAITVTATDTLGNVGTHQINIIRDNIPPRIILSFPQIPMGFSSFLTRDDNIAINGTVSKQDAVIDINGNDVPNQSGNFAYHAQGLRIGENPFTIRAVDRLGNESFLTFNIIHDPEMLAIDSVSPQEAIPGSTITIAGTGFSPTASQNQVNWGGGIATQAANVTPGGSFLRGVVPAGASSGPISVTVAGNQSNTLAFSVPTLDYIEILPDRSEIRIVNGITALAAIARYSNNVTSDVSSLSTWNTSDPSKATVDVQGRVTGHQEGQIVIRAEHRGKSDQVLVDVLIRNVSVAVAIDVSPSMENQHVLVSGGTGKPIDYAQNAARSLVQSLRATDRGSIVSFSEHVTTRPFTTDKNTLLSEINGLQISGWTSLYDAVIASIRHADVDVQANPQQKGAVLILGDGDDNRSQASIDQARDVILQYPHIEVYFAFIPTNAGTPNNLRDLYDRLPAGRAIYAEATDLSQLDYIFREILNRARDNPVSLELLPRSGTLFGQGHGMRFTARATFDNGQILEMNQTADWRVANPDVVTVDADGDVTARQVGQTTVICRAGGIGSKVEIQVGMPPEIREIIPNHSVPGAAVNIVGRGFAQNSADNVVTFNGVRAPLFAGDPTTLLVQVPQGATSGPVLVTTNGNVSGSFAFTVDAVVTSTDLIVTIPQNRRALVYWEDPGTAASSEGYYVYSRALGPAYSRQNTSPTRDTLFELGGLYNGQNFTVKLHAVDTQGTESVFGSPVMVTPVEFYAEMELNRVPTWGTASEPRPDPQFRIVVKDRQGNLLAGRRILIRSEGDAFEFFPDVGVTDAQGEFQGTLLVRDSAGITHDQLRKIYLFIGEMAEALESGALPASLIPRLTALESREHIFSGDRMLWTNRIPGLSAFNPYASRPLVFKVLVVDARKELAFQNFFIRTQNDIDIPGFQTVPKPLDSQDFEEFMRRFTRFENGAARPLTQGGSGGISATDVGKIVGEILLSIFIPGWDAVDIVKEVWKWADDQEPSYLILTLASLGLAADLATIFGVGAIGNVGMGVLKGLAKALDVIDPGITRWLVSGYDEAVVFFKYVAGHAPGGFGSQIGQVFSQGALAGMLVGMTKVLNKLKKFDDVAAGGIQAGKAAVKAAGDLADLGYDLSKVSDDFYIGMAKIIKQTQDPNVILRLASNMPPSVVKKSFTLLGRAPFELGDEAAEGLLWTVRSFRAQGMRFADADRAVMRLFGTASRHFDDAQNAVSGVMKTVKDFAHSLPAGTVSPGAIRGFDEVIKDMGCGHLYKFLGSWTQLKLAAKAPSGVPPARVLQMELRVPPGGGSFPIPPYHGHFRRPDLQLQQGSFRRLTEIKSNDLSSSLYQRGYSNIPLANTQARRRHLIRKLDAVGILKQAEDTLRHAKATNQLWGIAFSFKIPANMRSDFIAIFNRRVFGRNGITPAPDPAKWLSDGIL